MLDESALLVAMDRNSAGIGRADGITRVGRQGENNRLVGLDGGVVDGADVDCRIAPTRWNVRATLEPLVVHRVGRGAADRVEYGQDVIETPAGARDAESAGIAGRDLGGAGIERGNGNSGQWRVECKAGASIVSIG